MTNFEKFITFTSVVLIKNELEFLKLINYLRTKPLSYISFFTKMTYTSVRSNGGAIVIPEGELAVEYQMGKGCSCSTVKSYVDYGCEVLSVDDLVERESLINV